jgi:adenosylcobinamide-phosphate synthase
MDAAARFGILAAALLLDRLVGDPPALWSRLPHPVALVGRLVARADRNWNADYVPEATRRRRGVTLAALLVAGSMALGLLLHVAFAALPFGFVLEIVAVAVLLAQGSLVAHVRRVGDALAAEDLGGARQAAGAIVGREVSRLDEPGVARAAIESLAENFSDGVVAPAFWGALAGLPGIAGYKAINTADSMIGHLTPRHRDFGWAAARLDDLVNLPPARLSALFLAGAALFHRGTDAKQALLTAWQDARTHRSPNAGWPEAALAGALGLRLGGPRTYGGMQVNHGWIGSCRAALGSQDIRAALRLYRTACLVQIGFYGLLLSLILPM